MNKISVVISAYNEETSLSACLESLSWADEIVVIDNSSTDKTNQIAKKFTKKVFTQANNPLNIDVQKNFGFTKATSNWILSIDADERVSQELADEIKKVVQDTVHAGFQMPRKNIVFGKWIEHSFLWPDHQLRLFRKGKGQYTSGQVHQQMQIEGSIGMLENSLLHENYQSISQFLQKMDRYTENEANSLLEKNTHFHWIDAVRLPIRDFLKTFFLQNGYKDGLHGLVFSTLQAFYTFLVWAKVWEKQGFVQVNDEHFIQDLFTEWKKLHEEIQYWFYTTLISEIKNPITKTKLKLQKKMAERKTKK
jgi:glycosyltransferase involved in cell wall biosynthesis